MFIILGISMRLAVSNRSKQHLSQNLKTLANVCILQPIVAQNLVSQRPKATLSNNSLRN